MRRFNWSIRLGFRIPALPHLLRCRGGTFGVRRLAFGVWRLAFGVRRWRG